MRKLNQRTCRMAGITAVVLFAVMGVRLIFYLSPDLLGFRPLQSVLYIGLCIAWGVSVNRRVMQVQVRRQLTVIAGLMVFWLAARGIKYDFVNQAASSRYFWYLYYLPMIFIPLYALFTAMLLGKSERARLPRFAAVLACISLGLFLLVMTNDLHQLVFVFPAGKPWTDYDYWYALGYYIIVTWLVVCGLGLLVMLLRKCRVPHSRKFIWLPCIPVVALVGYTILYLFRVPWLRLLFGDMPAIFCLFYAAVLESCMQTGLIQTNTGYDLLFEAATFKAQITDEAWHTRYASVPSPLEPDVLSRAKDAPLHLDRNTLLRTHPIAGGYVAWQEDVTELADALERLEENQQELAEETFLEQASLEARQEVLQLQEKNRLYDLIGTHTRPQVELLNTLLEEYERAGGENARRRLLERICVIGAYVKRSGNLLLIRESSETVPVQELTKALEESLQNLELSGTECGLSCAVQGSISAAVAVEVYALFQRLTETALGRMDYLWVNLRRKGERLLLRMELESEADLLGLGDSARVQSEDGVWLVTAGYHVGGEPE